jgi:hypothetical protein
MTTMALFRKRKQPDAPPKRERAADSLDFRDVEPAKPAQPVRTKRTAKPAKKAVPAKAAKTTTRTGIVVPALIGGAIALLTAHLMKDSTPDSPPPVPVKAASRPPQAVPQQAPKAAPPPVVSRAPQVQMPAAPRANIPAVPTAFLEPFQAYTAEPGAKAIALALDRDGRFAHAAVSRHPDQAEANGEALADCERYRAKADIKETCRLFAIGDKIVW